jgi:hypothetical protein
MSFCSNNNNNNSNNGSQHNYFQPDSHHHDSLISLIAGADLHHLHRQQQQPQLQEPPRMAELDVVFPLQVPSQRSSTISERLRQIIDSALAITEDDDEVLERRYAIRTWESSNTSYILPLSLSSKSGDDMSFHVRPKQ